MPDVLHDGTHIQALYDDRQSSTLLITFNEMDIFANGKNYWSDVPARNLKISCLGIMSKTRNWFPVEEMVALALKCAPQLRAYKYIITYGFSQGAYGAIKYSHLFRASHILAFSPQWSINPANTGHFDLRFSSHFVPALHRNMNITRNDISGLLRIFVDPYEAEDFKHASIIADVLAFRCIVPCFNLGHGTVRAVASTDALASLLDIAISSENNQQSLFAFIKERKKTSFAYFFALGVRALKHRHTALSLRLYVKAQTINPSHSYLPAWHEHIRRASQNDLSAK